jgi:aspartate aminotransferase
MKIAKNVAQVKPSLTLAISAKAKALNRQGIDVIALSAGEPDFDTPVHICDAAVEAIREGFTRYTPSEGIPELKRAICNTFRQQNGLTYSQDQVIVNCGAKHSDYLAIMALIESGDEVIIPSPYWVSYPDMVKLAGGLPVIVDATIENGLKITPEQLKAAITPRTRLLVLNSPSNPTGVVYTREELVALGKVVEETGIMVISDEIYQKLIYDGNKHYAFAGLSEQLYHQTITIDGVSKTYAMTGWRIGYTAGPIEVIKAMATIQSQEVSNPCSISQKAALAALEGPQDFLSGWVDEFSRRRMYVTERLNAIEGVNCPLPGGAFYVFPHVSKLYGKYGAGAVIDGSIAFCEYMLKEHHIAIVPGIGFGNDNHIRISYALSMETLKVAMDRFEAGVRALA